MSQLATANGPYQSPRHQNSDVAFASKYQSIICQAGQLISRPMSVKIFRLQAILKDNTISPGLVKILRQVTTKVWI